MTALGRAVLVPIDDTSRSREAICVATTIARALDVPVQLVTVLSPGSEALESRIEMEALGAVIGDRARPPLVLRSNDVACALVEESAREHAMLCMSTHARGALGALVLGSTTAHVAARSKAPFVLVGPHASATDRLETIVVASPPDERAERALDAAIELAGPARSAVRLLRIARRETDADLMTATFDELTSLVDRCAERDVTACPQVAIGVDVAGTLVSEIEDAPADLMVLTARRHPMCERLIGGDVVREVVRRATCPVLVVPHGTEDEGE